MMQRTWYCWLPALGLAALVGLVSFRAAVAGDKDDGFKSLFNGKDMSGFKYVLAGKKTIEGDDPLMAPTKTWRVEDGVIICTGKPNGYFYTDKSYKNYVIRFDWKYIKDGNSGLLVHIQPPQKVWPKCVEVQGMQRDHGNIFAIGGAKGKFKTDKAAQKKAIKMGEWNTTEVISMNGELTSKINGIEVSKGKSQLTEGPIGLQSEGTELHFKNIKIKVMP